MFLSSCPTSFPVCAFIIYIYISLTCTVCVQGVCRIRAEGMTQLDPYYVAPVTRLDDILAKGADVKVPHPRVHDDKARTGGCGTLKPPDAQA
jgi:hypothetical protein